MAQKYNIKNMPREEFFASGHRGCVGCCLALAVRLAAKALGPDIIVVNATGCLEIISSAYPETAWEVPWIHTLFENTAAVASGVEAAYKVMKRKGYFPADRPVKIVAMAGDGGTADIGFQALSGALERGHEFVYICYDNEAYMNTGVQRSGATPYGASTTTSPAGKASSGQKTWKKNMPLIAVAHNIPYVATANPSYPFDLMNKVSKAKDVKGPAYIHVFAGCPTGWRSPSDTPVELGKLATQTGVFPLYEVENGKWTMKVESQLKPVKEYLTASQGRYKHLSEETINIIQDRVTREYAELKSRCGIV
ncbi:MAG: pyruvate synthase subunit beta [Deltaproteobacteria bacterium]|nr:pyruvate synthase subunit beta [Deltaproteobacteria bacterium]